MSRCATEVSSGAYRGILNESSALVRYRGWAGADEDVVALRGFRTYNDDRVIGRNFGHERTPKMIDVDTGAR